MKRIEFYLTPAEGKRLIAKALAALPDIQKAVREHTAVIVAGTTNTAAAEELLRLIGQEQDFDPSHFFRGVTAPAGRIPKGKLEGDVVIRKGEWLRGKTIFDVGSTLKQGDIILKGANAVQLEDREAALLIGHPAAGTGLEILSAVCGRRVKLYLPVGTEKRVSGKIGELVRKVNDPETEGLRMLSLPGEIVTELDAVRILTGAKAELIAAGGVFGAEGCSYYLAEGTEEALGKLRALTEAVAVKA